jgi:hypothetical protein
MVQTLPVSVSPVVIVMTIQQRKLDDALVLVTAGFSTGLNLEFIMNGHLGEGGLDLWSFGPTCSLRMNFLA